MNLTKDYLNSTNRELKSINIFNNLLQGKKIIIINFHRIKLNFFKVLMLNILSGLFTFFFQL